MNQQKLKAKKQMRGRENYEKEVLEYLDRRAIENV